MKELDLILKNIKNKTFQPIYFFHGEEPFFIDTAIKSFENDVLEEDEKAFNQTVVYGKDTTFTEVLSLARQFPMMGDKQVIIVKEAQHIDLSESESAALKAYAENPVESTILVIGYKYKKIDARKAFVKTLNQKKMLFLSEKVKDYQLSNWISAEIKNLGLQSKPNIPVLLAEYLGNDLSRVYNELQKLKMILKDDEILDEKVVETHIGISKDFNVFELTRALGERNEAAAFKIGHFLGKSKTHSFVMTSAVLYNFFSNLIIYHTMPGQSPQAMATAMGVNPYAIRDLGSAARLYNLKQCTRIISVLREIDMKSKGLGAINTNDEELFKELIYKILHIHQYKVSI